MYVPNWESFYQQAEALYAANPLTTRYTLKYRHCDGKLCLKVTDNATCLKFLIDKQSDLRKVEKLNALFFSLMTAGTDPGTAAAASKPQRPQRGGQQKL